MRPMFIVLVAVALVAVPSPSPVEASCRDCGVAAGVVGGLAAGAIIGSAIANGQPRYLEPAPVYEAPPSPPAYVEPPDYVEGPVCHTERQQVWDGYGYRTRRVEVCD